MIFERFSPRKWAIFTQTFMTTIVRHIGFLGKRYFCQKRRKGPKIMIITLTSGKFVVSCKMHILKTIL
jgi:hypothetical protein